MDLGRDVTIFTYSMSKSNYFVYTLYSAFTKMANILLEIVTISVKLLLFTLELLGHYFIKFIQIFVPKPRKSLKNEIILITGAASGIGQLMAFKFAAQGAKMIICWDVDEQGNEKTVDRLLKEGYNAFGLKCDLSKREEVYAVAEKTKKLLKLRVKSSKSGDPSVTMLVNNAGIVNGKTLLNSTDNANQITMDVNANSHFWTIKNFLPEMIKNDHGHIVTISSICGIVGVHGLVDYCSSKFAVLGMTESLYMELKRINSKVKCTVICPYLIHTGLFAGAKPSYEWLVPSLLPNDVANRIVEAVRRNEYLVIMPKVLKVVYWLKGILGFKMVYKLGDILGFHTGMDSFVGRKKE